MSEQNVEKDVLLVAQSFWKKNQKIISTTLAILIVVVGGWYGYQEYVVKPKENKAAEAIYKLQELFAIDSSNLVINGDNTIGAKGALYIIKNYSGTKSSNLAYYYAGISYLKLKDFNNAIKYLKEFSTSAKQVQMAAYTALGHAYAETNKKEEAVEYYTKAGTFFEKDEFNSAENLFLAASLLETMNKTKEALELYKKIKEKYPNTDKGFQVDKYIYKLSNPSNDFSIN